ncbi:MAG: T9SS type A sorting domain-containing protein [Ignavibacteriae bacterium]|nr:T9SS type A sorting domain-containing protein [Ignavibacteriota bacterium]
MKIFKLILIAFFFLSNFTYAYTELRINNPQTWYVGQGTIKEATLSIQPKGIYFEYNLYLTFSAINLGLTHEDTVEIIYNFNLPQNSIVHDSWLWFNGEIIKGKILDRWTASQIYEQIVGRRQDPSILVKNYNDQYELRVFPLAGDETRKVKLTFLVPAIWNSANVTAEIPTYLLHSSYILLENFDLQAKLTDDWKNPKVLEFADKSFSEVIDSTNGNYLSMNFVKNEIYSNSNLTFSIDAPFKNGIYLSKFEGTDENLYQLAFLPAVPQEVMKNKKAVILIDYQISNSSTTKNDVLNGIKRMLHQYFSEQDSFNLILSNKTINRISENWISADSNSIENTFNNLTQNLLSDYSNLPSLLSNGIQFINGKNNEGQIILLANSDNVGEAEVANSLIEDLMKMMNEIFPINVGNFQENYTNWYYYGGIDYLGNSYFYQNLTRLTGGNLFSTDYQNSFNAMINNLFTSLNSLLSTYDLHTALDNGFTYGRFDFNTNDNLVSLNTPILQIGKYIGTFPFNIEFNGIYDGTPFSNSEEVTDKNTIIADSISDVIWAGKFISTIEGNYDYYYSNLTNQEIYEIIDLSVNKKVLTKYTAFLCLEPGMEIDITDPNQFIDDGNGEWVVDVEETEEINSDTLFTSYPNPFNNQTTIKIRLSNKINPETATFKIYNVLGQVVKTFIPSANINETKEFEFFWNGENDNNSYVASGNYFFVMQHAGKVKTLKLVLVK